MINKRKHIIRVLRGEAYKGSYRCNFMFDKSPEFLDEYYSRQAALDLLDLVMSGDEYNLMNIVEDYRDKMDRYSTMSEKFGIIYSIKYDFATYILDRLIA